MNHVTARSVVAHAIPLATPAQSQALRAVAAFENNYGDAGKFKGSNNWGCLTGEGDLGSIDHPDSRPTSTGQVTYVAKFRRYSSPERGAIGLGHTLFKPVTLKAIANGSLLQVAAAMYGYGYYTGFTTNGAQAIADYATGLARNLRAILDATKEPPAFGLGTGTAYREPEGLFAWNTVLRRSDGSADVKNGILRSAPALVTAALVGVPESVTASPMRATVPGQPVYPASSAPSTPAPMTPPGSPDRRFYLIEATSSGYSVHGEATYSPTAGWSSWHKPQG